MAKKKTSGDKVPKGKIVVRDGKKYKSLGNGNFEGVKSPRMRTVKKSPSYNSKKKKVTKRKFNKPK